MTKDEEVMTAYDIIAQLQHVIEDLLPDAADSPVLRRDSMMSPLSNKNLKHSLPEAVINIFNKLYSRRFDFERQAKKFNKDRFVFEQNIARVDAKLSLMQTLNGRGWQDAI
mmetsp:Transcript_44008/g.58393  ORF Transcript_44008/g.58393 Transcript_44008/m.58393 type:complete len:111 (-) Transcript_44008:305-637(-)